jgi:septal ring factor EnvC (AmiA/AmiB activator)
MSQLKPMIIVLLMLTSALAGCTGTDTTDLEQQIEDLQQSNDEMNETINQQNQDNLELRTLLEGLQLSLDDLDMELQQSNDEMNETINQQRQDLIGHIWT